MVARVSDVNIKFLAAGHRALGPALQPPQLLRVADAAAMLPAGPLTLVGSGALLLREAAARTDLELSDAAPDPDPVILARLAMQRPKPSRAPSPLYIRPPDAALPKTEQPRAQLAVAIESCGIEAAELLAALHSEAFEIGWTKQALAELLAMPGAFALLARTAAPAGSGQPAGFLLLRQAADEAEIITLAVRPRLQRQPQPLAARLSLRRFG